MIVLASASPRRRELLGRTGLAFEVRVSDIDETVEPGTDPEHTARELAARKARAVAERSGAGRRGLWVLGADTVVAVGPPGAERLLGKPGDEAEAGAMLGSLSGTRHRVVTGVCVLRGPDGAERLSSETTWVTMRAITPDEREAYVASGEWRDKAGGYAIQETADRFVTGLEGGGFDNVVGLPVRLALELLEALGAPLEGVRLPGA